MKKNLAAILTAFMIIAGLTMCTTVKPEPEPAIEQPAPVEPAPLPEPEPVTETETEVENEVEEFVVTEELYVETFEDIRSMINNLNEIITAKDYETWLSYLTSEYIDFYSSPEQLSYWSELYKQRGYNQRINDFNDYFSYVVVQSRRNPVINEISFDDSTHITAFTEINGRSAVLYYLEKNENEWKIGLKPEN